MKKSLFLICFVLLGFLAFSQNISVSSFRCLENDINARGSKVTDQNGELCALIIVNTGVQGLEFTGCSIEKTEQKTGEIWLFVSPGVKFITIKHRDLGSLRNYPFPISIKKGTTYEMVLKTAKITQIVEESVTDQYLIIRSNTPEAKIFINDEYVGKNNAQKYLPLFEEHSYRVEAPLYHTKSGKVRLNSEDRTELQIDLDPAFGYLKVNTSPVEGAEIEINGKLQDKTTPFTTQALASGVYTLQAFKTMYKSNPVEVHLHDGESVEVNIDLIPTFANVEIVCQDKEAEIHIDGQYKAKGSWKSAMPAGNHRLEVKKSSYRTFSKNLNVVSGNDFVEDVPLLQAINGKLNISSNPFDADIFIDGKHFGKTPRLIPQVLIGQHSLKLSKEGYADVNEKIIIEEGKISDYAFDLKKVCSVTINSDPSNAKIEINGNSFGYTPTKINSLEEGEYNLVLSKEGYKKVEDKITLKTGFNSPLSYSLQTSDRFLNISSSPSGASVYLNGSYKGSTPLSIKNEETGTHKLKLIKSGYKDLSEKIKVKGEARESFSFDMKKKKQIVWKDIDECHFYASTDMSYAGEFYYGASLSWAFFPPADDGVELGIPGLQLGVTYLTDKGIDDKVDHRIIGTLGYIGFRIGYGLYSNSDYTSLLLGYGITIKRMILYLDYHLLYEKTSSSSTDNSYSSYYKSATKDFHGINFGIGFCF